MKNRYFLITMILFASTVFEAGAVADPYILSLSRMFSKDMFDKNGTLYLQPMVQSLNSTANSRFFTTAYVPSEVKKPYFRFGLHGMLGFVRDDQKTYVPIIPAEPLDVNELSKYMTYDIINNTVTIKDTASLIYYAFKTIMYDGVQQGKLNFPTSTPTVLGKGHVVIEFPDNVLDTLVMQNPAFALLPPALQDSLLSVIGKFPTYFTMLEGGDMSTLVAGIPQFEIGSIFGTELLLRFIPPVNMGQNIGNFSFWGIGLKHSISQYFYKDESKRPFDMALQVVYQGTHLDNEVGVTGADLSANASIWDINLHFSKSFEGILDLYSGFSFEFLNIKSEYTYYLPIELQWQIGLIDPMKDSTGAATNFLPTPPEFPGDTDPQFTNLELDDFNFKWIIGIAKQIGPIAIFLDYSISKFNIFSGGIEVRF